MVRKSVVDAAVASGAHALLLLVVADLTFAIEARAPAIALRQRHRETWRGAVRNGGRARSRGHRRETYERALQGGASAHVAQD